MQNMNSLIEALGKKTAARQQLVGQAFDFLRRSDVLFNSAAHLTQKSLAQGEVEDLIDSSFAGPETLSILQQLQEQGQKYGSLDEISVGIQQALLKNYLESTGCTLLSESSKFSASQSDIARLVSACCVPDKLPSCCDYF